MAVESSSPPPEGRGTRRSGDPQAARRRRAAVPLIMAVPAGATIGAVVGAGIWVSLAVQGLGGSGVVSLVVTFAAVGSMVALVAAVGSVVAVLAARRRSADTIVRIAVGAGISVGTAVLLTGLLGASRTWWSTAAWVAAVAAVVSAAVAALIAMLGRRLLHR